MKEIKYIVEEIHEELEGAEHYAKKAMQHKDTHKSLADMYSRLAAAELDHVNVLHDQAVKLIKAKREAGVEPPAAMMAVWDWEHNKAVDTAGRIRAILSMYRDG